VGDRKKTKKAKICLREGSNKRRASFIREKERGHKLNENTATKVTERSQRIVTVMELRYEA